MDEDPISKLVALALTQDMNRRGEMNIIKEMLAMVIAYQAADMEDGEAYILRISEALRISLDQTNPSDAATKELWSEMERTIDDLYDKMLSYLNLERLVRADQLTRPPET